MEVFGFLFWSSVSVSVVIKGDVNMPNIDIIFQIAGIGVLIAIFSIVLEQAQKKEQGQMLTLVGVVVIC